MAAYRGIWGHVSQQRLVHFLLETGGTAPSLPHLEIYCEASCRFLLHSKQRNKQLDYLPGTLKFSCLYMYYCFHSS